MATNGSGAMSEGPNGQIIMFGDSITEDAFQADFGISYGASMSHAFRRKLDVINRGFSGYNTRHAVMCLPQFIPTTAQAKVELLIVCFGANDCCLPHDPTDHHVPLSEFRDNLVSIITSPELAAHRPRVLLVTPTPVDEYQQAIADEARGFNLLRRTAENMKAYAQACQDIGSQLKVPVVDTWRYFLQHAGWIEGQEHLPGSRKLPANKTLQSLLSDGLHLTPSGYQLVYEAVMASIKANYPDIDPDKMPLKYPPWDQAPKRGRNELEHDVEQDNGVS